MKNICVSLIVLIALTGCSANEAGKKKKGDGNEAHNEVYIPKVIYGDDNRLDYYQVTDTRLQTLSDSTVALVRASDLTSVPGTTTFSYDPTTFEQSYALCKSEPFREQPSAGFCSGFLVGKNLVATAGHCIRTASDCSGARFVFGYKMNSSSVNPTHVDASQVYSCSKIVHSVVEMTGKDFAVIQLDRDVPDHTPLAIRRTGTLGAGDAITVMGYPSGIPLKVSGGANVRRLEKGYFVANLDTYGGNSGSAVFNSATGEVEGILVRGETDFVAQGNCRVSKRCGDNDCRGEDVTYITEALEHIPALSSGGSGGTGGNGTTPPAQPTRQEYAMKSAVAIPDNSKAGVLSTVIASESPRGRKVKVKVNITHTWRGDLRLSLVTPKGKEILLSNRAGRAEDNIVGVYGAAGESFTAAGLAELSGLIDAGVWTLKVSDHAKRDTGTLNAWSLIFD